MAAVIGGAAAGLVPGMGGKMSPEKMADQLYDPFFWAQMGLMFAIPSLLAYVAQSQHSVGTLAGKAYRKLTNETVRTIEFKYSNDYWFNQSQDDRNNILQKAITLYLGTHCKTTIPNLKEGQIRLMQSQEKEESWSERTSGVFGSAQLRKWGLTPMPALNEKQEIAPGLWFEYSEDPDENAGIGETRVIHTYTFTSYGFGASKRIDDFIMAAYKEYIETLRKEQDTARYLYQMQTKDFGSSEKKGKPPVYKKYKLSDDKTFDSLFFSGKKEILALIDDFVAGRGKFSIEGFPNKLGLLLHGPPGTGKTSFVKALAQHTNRHIVTVPLAKLNTNQELYDIMFDLVFPTKDDDGVNQRFTFRDVIFLLEDIDASSEVVMSRKKKADEQTEEDQAMAALMKWMMEPAKKGDSGGSGGGGGAGGNDVAADTAAGFDVVGGTGTGTGGGFGSLFDRADKLDLAGLLNVLDGVVDSPGRIVIMTTNHPESLDAALIRPGRINTKLHMGYMSDDDIVEMFEHHFDEITTAHRTRLRKALQHKRQHGCGGEDGSERKKFNISGAEVEQLCAECDTIDEFIEEMAAYPRLHHDLQAQVAQYL
eukprot:CAMPEP_0174835698 /NCGR_PEP_ID=MMETSP1114-20130205/5539_1 /TAXON_ID=312471 /ORGANISM="Neobodo designis, Strain CCAP 1951/1" /LENGTH=592 /DNA_ID=CAMNT_0016069651 /DNA_START=82 /DNA_END=1860 /DNA_ORIENTATION=+